jgi:hypothetical protein
MEELIQKYAAAIQEATIVCKAAEIKEDGGTANLDSVVIDFTGWRSTSIKRIEQLAGIHIGKKLSGLWKGCCFIDFPVTGQGYCRTQMVAAAEKKLKEHGIPAMIYYQMD